MAASYCSTTLAGMRPRSLTAMPWPLAHARISPLRSRRAAVRPGRCRCPRSALRACSMKVRAAYGRLGVLLVQIDLVLGAVQLEPHRLIRRAPIRSSASATVIFCAIPASLTAIATCTVQDQLPCRSKSQHCQSLATTGRTPPGGIAPAQRGCGGVSGCGLECLRQQDCRAGVRVSRAYAGLACYVAVSKMWDRIGADLALVVHLLFIGFVVGGAFLPWRWPRIIWLQLPAMVYGALIQFVGFSCPLTSLDNYLLRRAGDSGYRAGFISRYLFRPSTRPA